jgi:hypothetical protein
LKPNDQLKRKIMTMQLFTVRTSQTG